MGLSALTLDLQKRGIDVENKTNLRKYYNVYPHAIKILLSPNETIGYNSDANKLCVKIKAELKAQLDPSQYQMRREWYALSIFSMNVFKTLDAIEHCLTKRAIEKIIIERMPQDIISETSVRPELPKAHTVVVKKLPYDQYRYRVYWPATRNILREIGSDALEAITAQINADPTCKPIKDKTVRSLHTMGYQYGARYFYTNHEDIFSIISLISPRFISRIEKFITIEEINEKNIS